MVSRRALIVAPLYDGQWLPPLAGRPDVVKRLTKCLKEQGGYDVKALDGIVKPPELLQAIEDFFSSDGELFFYFYGHGCVRKNGNGYFAASSARNFEEGIPMAEVITSAVTSKAQEIVLILDCCHAGAATEVTSVTITGLAEQAIQQAGRVLLAGCASHQNGWEVKADDEQKKIGAFSYHVLKGLEGEASYGRGKVRGSMLGTYVTEVFKAWNQDPISLNREAGSRECIITSGFPIKAIPVPSSEASDKQARLIGLPFKPSQLFVGRSAEIDSLRTLLTVGDKQVAVSATVEGLGGIGKTEVILQLIYQPDILATYKTVVWLDGAGPLPPQWEKVAIELGLKNRGTESTELIQLVERKLRMIGNPLIVLDNASEWKPVANLIPKGIALLVTTRTQGFGGNDFRHLELGVLSDESATNFLIQMVAALENDPSLPQLVNALEGHALALELAGWNINYLGISAGKYLQRLDKRKADYDRALEATKYGKTVDACLALTWDGLKYDASRVLWRRASLFAPTSAHRDLLQLSFTGDERTRYEIRRMSQSRRHRLKLLLSDPEEFDNAYAELRSFHVLARVEGSNSERWAMHRLVRAYGRERLQGGEVVFHTMSLSEWLRRPTLPLEPEIPHLVSAILDSARYASEFSSLLKERSVSREIFSRSISSDEITLRFDSSQFINYIREQLRDPKALTMILEGLVDINEDVRVQSIRLLENVGPIPEVLEGLASSLGDPDLLVRETAGRTLAKHGGDRTVSILSAAVNNPNERISLTAVKALGFMGEKAYAALREALDCEHQASRIEAALLLCEHKQQEGSQTLIDAIHSVSKQEQGRFIDALGNVKDPKAVPTIVNFLSEKSHCINAIRALERIGDSTVYSQLVVFLKSEGDGGVGDAAKKVLTGEVDFITLKNELNSNEDTAIRNKIALLLCEHKQQEGSQTLIDAIHSVSKQEQGRFIDALGNVKDPKAVPTITRFLSDAENRLRAIQALGEIGDASVYPNLVELLEINNSDVKCALIKSIEKLNVPDGFNRFIDALSQQITSAQVSDPFPGLALEMLQRNNVSLPLELITWLLLKSVNWKIRQRSAVYLGEAKNAEAVPFLIEALKDSDCDVRNETSTALGLIGDPRAEARLAEVAANDSSEKVKKAASKALGVIREEKT
jgi:HEAT repeat protein